MTQAVDLVVAGLGRTARAAAIAVLRRGRRVLVVLSQGGAAAGQRCRRTLRHEAGAAVAQLAVVTNADVVCVDGVRGVEAVLVRYRRSGRLWAVNAAAFVADDDAGPHARRASPAAES